MAEINVTPFVDVMLVLLVIFMITAPLMQYGMEVQLPEESTAPIPVKDVPTVTLKNNKRIFWRKQEMPNLLALTREVEKYSKAHKNAGIYFRADKTLDYGFIMRVLTTVKKGGVQSIGMITELPNP